MRLRKWPLALLVLSFSCASCSFIEKHGVNLAVPVLKGTVDNIMTLESANLAKEGLPGQLILISALVEFSPNNDQLLALASQAYASYGLAVEWENPEYAIELYEIGKNYGLKALKHNNTDIYDGLKEGKHLADLAGEITVDDVPAACWYGLNAGLQIILEMEDPYVLIGLGDVTKVFERILALKDDYFYYVAHLFQGSYYIIAGIIGGGGPERAKEEFDAAFEKTDNNFLLAHTFYARYYAVSMLNEGLFDKMIEYVLNTPNNVLPDARLVNDIAKKKAFWLKEHKNLFF